MRLPTGPRRRGERGRRLGRLALLLAPLVLLLSACIPTTYEYPVDYFNEMHYQQSYRRQEPARLSVPPGSVPTTGGTAALPTPAVNQLQNPTQRTPQNMQLAMTLYQRNCVPCHGAQGKGDGFVVNYFKSVPNTPIPKPYDDPSVKAMSDGEIYGIITNGLRDEQTLVGMPAWRSMLTDEERWLLVDQIRAFQGQ